MGRSLVIVESPAKARTIAKYLGKGYVVESSIGHVRDLPSTAKEIPPKYKSESWARTGVNVEKDFEPLYIVPAGKKAQVQKLKALLRDSDELILATDEDREGEAIAWHLKQVLKPKVPVKRMVFDEITKAAIQRAVDSTRDLDDRLVDAQEARRILDRLYGYEVSPVLWRKVRPRLSAGRVQSVATRLVVDRERARRRFVSAGYWSVQAQLRADGASPFAGGLVELGGKPVVTGKDFDAATGELVKPGAVALLDEARATRLARELEGASFAVAAVTEKPFTQRPPAPFITSTLQQEAGRKLRYTADRTMRAAQRLYENGYITYMRTDSTSLSTQALDAARAQATDLYGADHVPAEPRRYTRKVKGAQEAHEAIRPAGETFRTPDQVAGELADRDERAVYELIWKRTIASQMKDASGTRTQARIRAESPSEGAAVFTASGKVIRFAGFLRAYVEGSDDPDAELADQERILPPLAEGDALDASDIEARSHATQPPARFTEASLIKELEDRGIGRPSTYATIIRTIQDRGYVWKKGSALVPTLTAFAVTNLLERHFGDLVDYEFTARMEGDLDRIAAGETEPRPWLARFYFGDASAPGDDRDDVAHVGLKERVGSGWEAIDAREVSSLPLGKDPEGQEIVARVGRYGPYVQAGDSDVRASLPDELPLDELDVPTALGYLAKASTEDVVLGQDPGSDKPVYLKDGRFGPYVQLGDPERTEKGAIKKGSKPKMASLWPSMTPEDVTLEQALMLLSFPREVGPHPESGEMIYASPGRYGPYLKMGTDTRSLETHEQLLSVTVPEALQIFAQPKRRGRASAAPLVDLGPHPESGEAMTIRTGRFGPYVTDGEVNASVPRGIDPKDVDVDKAVDLLARRREKLVAQGKDPSAPKGKGAKKKAAKKKASKKKAARKKASKKKASKKKASGKKATAKRAVAPVAGDAPATGD